MRRRQPSVGRHQRGRSEASREEVATGATNLADVLTHCMRGATLRVGLLVPTAVYGGYFGAGLGVMLLAALLTTGRKDLRAANALKNLLAATVSAVTIPIFMSRDLVRWPETLVMLTGAICGGYLGGLLIKALAPSIVRKIVIAVGGAMAALYAGRYWL
jgi:uncharacterized protein